MKHYMQPKSSVLREAQATTDQTFNSPNPSSSSSKAKSTSSRKHRFAKENAPPLDLNAMPSPSPSKVKPPRPPPPPSNSLKRKLNVEDLVENAVSGCTDSGVKVIVRMRPPKDEEDGELIVQKTSPDSLTINGHAFTFDSVAEIQSTQLDIFQLVGAPLVENCLAGFNSSVFAYGQTGSGKTYTIWGPANALLEENLSSDQQGLTPRVFEQLFARINEEQIKHAAEQLTYQCRCSFLEIYNEQITDLLDPSQRNLQIREDVNSGVYVEDLTEERVFTMKDVTRLLIKGLSNRRTGATSINAESSRSHSVFTCVVDSHCESTSDGFSTFKTSRINLVDLAGSERQKLTGAAGERLKEAGNINRSLSQLGNLINILAEVSQTGKQRHIPYRDSRLTFLLQESLGGNAKLAMICAISPVQSCKSETFSTLRFAQRAKAIKNKAVVNEEMQDDVNSLREVIRQLKDELLFLKANGNKPNDSFGGGFARRSLNLLKLSFNRPMTLPRVEDDSDEEMEIDESVEKVNVPVGMYPAGSEENNTHEMKKVEVNLSPVDSQSKTNEVGYIPHVSEDMDINVKEGISEHVEEGDTMIVDCAEPVRNNPDCTSINALNSNIAEEISNTLNGDSSGQHADKRGTVSSSPSKSLSVKSSNEMVSSCPVSEHVGEVSEDISVSIAPFDSSRGSMNCIKSPTPSVSPRVSASRKSLRTSSMSSASQKDLKDDFISETDAVHKSSMKSSMHCSSNTLPTQRIRTAENLAASLHRGLEIIDSHSQSSALRRSLFGLSFNPSETKLILPVQKVGAGVQTSPEDTLIPEEGTDVVLCSNCKSKTQLEVRKSNESSNLQLVLPADESDSTEKAKKLVPKAVEKVLAGSFRREMALEEFCTRQNYEITQLKRLVQQYKHERECNAIITQTREDKILRLESLVDGVLPTEEFMEEELAALTNEHKLLKDRYENHPELLRTRIELKRVQDELEGYRNFFDMGEREVLLEEIHDLRSQLQLYIDSSSVPARKQSSIMRLTLTDHSLAQPLGTIPESGVVSAEEKLEQERVHWMEAESKWISLAEELRLELDGTRSMAEKQKQELDTEKRCAEELKEAMQLAMEGQVRMLEQYADLEEKHMNLLARHRKIRDGADDVKKAAAKAGVRGAESKFINALAAGISTLRAEKEKERQYLRDENKALQAQLRDTAEAVQAAGELLMRLKEAEEAVASAQNRAMEAERETEKAYKEMESLKQKHESDINTLNQLLAVSRLPTEAIRPTHDLTRYDTVELESFNAEDTELLKLPERSWWFSGYDQCNI